MFLTDLHYFGPQLLVTFPAKREAMFRAAPAHPPWLSGGFDNIRKVPTYSNTCWSPHDAVGNQILIPLI
jgi:hypothetical protein